MAKKKKTVEKDVGRTYEEAIKHPRFLEMYQILGKFYLPEKANTAPEKVEYGQCPVCGEFTWNEMEEIDYGECSSCGFYG